MNDRRNLFSRVTQTACALLCLCLLQSCGVNNHFPGDGTSAPGEASLEVTKAMADSLVLPSGMNRASGIEIVARLFELFPGAKLGTDPALCAAGQTFSLSSAKIRAAFDFYASPDLINHDAHKVLGDFWGPYPTYCGYEAGQISRYIPSLESIGVAERSSSALTQMSARILFDDLCSGNNLLPAATNLFTESPSLLMTGEQFPTDPAKRIAFTVARRAWGYPYTEDSPEVKVLADLYTSTDSAHQKQYLCQSAILSDQFWVGNPFQEDVLRRLTLPLVRRSPTFQQIESYKNGTLKVRDYVQSLQSDPEYLKTILRWHGDQLGLRTAPALNEMTTILAQNTHSANRIAGSYFETSYSINGKPLFGTGGGFTNDSLSHDGCVSAELSWAKNGFAVSPGNPNTTYINIPLPFTAADIAHTGQSPEWPAKYVEAAAGEAPPTFNAPFDPRTTGIYWEQYNPHSAKFEILAAWVLKPFLKQYQTALGADPVALNLCHPYTTDPRWYKCNGLITLNDNTKKQIKLEDVTRVSFSGLGYGTIATQTTDEDPAVGTRTNNLVGTPMEQVTLENTTYYKAPLRRAVRYSPPTVENPTGRNTSFSTIPGPASGLPMLACNSLARFMATCSYQPPKNRPDLAPSTLWFQIHNGIYYANEWNASKPQPYWGWGEGVATAGFTFAHPDVIRSFRCGNYNNSALAASDSSFNLDQAIPYGYDPLLPYDSTLTVDSQIPNSWLAGTTTGTTVTSVPSQNDLNSVATVSRGAFGAGNAANDPSWWGDGEMQLPNSIISGLEEEPYRLLTDVISNNKDYGLLTSANYTLVPKGLEFLYRSGGEVTPVRPPGYIPPAAGQDMNTVVTLDFSTMQNLPKRMYDIDSANQSGYRNLKRPAAGLLSMPGILDPMSDGTPRSISQRVFKRFLCGDANLYDPSADGALALHLNAFSQMANSVYDPNDTPIVQNFVTTHLSSGGKLLNDCMSCHQNLDPLGMGLFKYYGSFIAKKTILGQLSINSELRRSSSGGGTPGMVSDQDMLGDGVFLGKTVHGFAGVGQSIADSRLFYACATQTAFTNLFGRMASGVEARKVYTNAIDNFYKNRNYNQMILDLAEIQDNLGGQ